MQGNSFPSSFQMLRGVTVPFSWITAEFHTSFVKNFASFGLIARHLSRHLALQNGKAPNLNDCRRRVKCRETGSPPPAKAVRGDRLSSEARGLRVTGKERKRAGEKLNFNELITVCSSERATQRERGGG